MSGESKAMDRLERVAEYCKVDVGDPVIKMCYEAAVAYANNAGVPEPDKPNGDYDLLISMLALSWYDIRGTTTIGQMTHAVARTATALIISLKTKPVTIGEE